MSDVLQMRHTVRTETLQPAMLSWARTRRSLRQKLICAVFLVLGGSGFVVAIDLEMLGLNFWKGLVSGLFLCVASCLISRLLGAGFSDELMGQHGKGETT